VTVSLLVLVLALVTVSVTTGVAAAVDVAVSLALATADTLGSLVGVASVDVALTSGAADSLDAVESAVDAAFVVAGVATTSVLGVVAFAFVSTSSAWTAFAKIAVETSKVERVVATTVFFFIPKYLSDVKSFLLYHIL
jgi:hypothetical protein